MSKTVTHSVVVRSPVTGLNEQFLPGDRLPGWAEELVTNPKVFASKLEEESFDQDDDAIDTDDLTTHTVKQLVKVAENEGIDLGDATRKADIIAAIELARESNV